MKIARFFYKDLDFARSLYSQWFSGLLENVDISKTSESSHEKKVSGTGGGEFELPLIAKGEASCNLEITGQKTTGENKTEHLTPHDTILLDIMSVLRPHMRLCLSDCSYGDMFYIKGHFFFLPQEFQKTFIENTLKTLNSGDTGETNKKMRDEFSKSLLQFINSIHNDIKFYFKAEGGIWCTGFLRTPCFTESPLVLFSKYKGRPIPAHLVGIYEQTLPDSTIDASPHIRQLQTLANFAATVLDHGVPDPLPVLPLALFHPIGGGQQN